MNCKSVLKSGDRILIADGTKEYTSLIDEVFDEGNFSILQPFYQGRSVTLESGREYKFTCIKAGGLHYFNSIVIRTELSGQVHITYVRYCGSYLRLQRRNAFRSSITLDVEVRKKVEEPQPLEDWVHAKTLDVSETGMRVRLGPNFEKGNTIECNIKIDQFGIFTVLPTITCVIKRSAPLQNKADESICGVEFAEIDQKSRNLLLKLVMLSQRDSFAR